MWRALIVLGLLAGCAPRAALMSAPSGLDLPTRSVFVTTQRDIDPDTRVLTAARSPQSRHMQIDITLPPNRPEGEVAFPFRKPDPETDMLVSNVTPVGTQSALIAGIKRALSQSDEKRVQLYIHGYNNTFADGVLRTVQMAEDFDFNGVSAHYSWPSAGNALAYAFDRESIMASRSGLQDLIVALSGLTTKEFTVVAHSVGSDLLMEVLRDLAISGRRDVLDRLDGVVLISPDIDLDVFKAQATRIGKLPDPFIVIASPNDRALTVSARLTGQVSRVGSLGDSDELGAFDLLFLDVSGLSSGGDRLRHFTAASSPEAIRLIRQLSKTADALGRDAALRPGLIPGSVIRARQTTRIILGQP